MKNLRTYLWIGLALLLFYNFITWTTEFGPRDAAAAAAAQKAAEASNAAHPLTAEVPAGAGRRCGCRDDNGGQRGCRR